MFKASFSITSNRDDIDINDPEFWQKWAKKADVDVDAGGVSKPMKVFRIIPEFSILWLSQPQNTELGILWWLLSQG